jgi:hypothetical protein
VGFLVSTGKNLENGFIAYDQNFNINLGSVALG